MLNKINYYYRLSGRDKEKVKKTSYLMFKKALKVKEINSFYYVEEFLQIEHFEYPKVNIPRHKIINDLVLIVLSYSKRLNGSTIVYSNGLIKKTNYYYDALFAKHQGHITYEDYLLASFKKSFNEKVFQEFKKIKGSKLYYSFLKETHEIDRNLRYRYRELATIRRYINLNYKYFVPSKNLDFKTFLGLYA